MFFCIYMYIFELGILCSYWRAPYFCSHWCINAIRWKHCNMYFFKVRCSYMVLSYFDRTYLSFMDSESNWSSYLEHICKLTNSYMQKVHWFTGSKKIWFDGKICSFEKDHAYNIINNYTRFGLNKQWDRKQEKSVQKHKWGCSECSRYISCSGKKPLDASHVALFSDLSDLMACFCMWPLY